MDSEERRNKIIVGVVVIVVAVVIVGLILLKTSNSSLTCQLSDLDPSTQKVEHKRIVSADNKALAYFDGHLKYELANKDNKRIFLPLELSSILAGGPDHEGAQQLVFNLNCAQLNVTLRSEKAADKTTDVMKATEVKLQLTTPNDKLSSCTVSNHELLVYSPSKHFACDNFELACETESQSELVAAGSAKKLVTLSMGKLEFELGGDVDKHKELQFSTDADTCSKSI